MGGQNKKRGNNGIQTITKRNLIRIFFVNGGSFMPKALFETLCFSSFILLSMENYIIFKFIKHKMVVTVVC